jgi:CRP-like cAMP-binding protein
MEKLFETHENFKQFTADDRAILIQHGTMIAVKKDHVIFKDGEVGDTAYIIKEGLIRVFKQVAEDQIVTLEVAKRGMIFGEMAIFDIIPRYAGAIALADSELFVITKQQFMDIREKNPKTALAIVDVFIKYLSVHLRNTTNRAYGLYAGPAA